MTDSEFQIAADQILTQIEHFFESATETGEFDVECSRSGNVLSVEFIENNSRMIINSQAPMKEIWVAGKAGGFHYRFDGEHWRDTRSQLELFSSIRQYATQQTEN